MKWTTAECETFMLLVLFKKLIYGCMKALHRAVAVTYIVSVYTCAPVCSFCWQLTFPFKHTDSQLCLWKRESGQAEGRSSTQIQLERQTMLATGLFVEGLPGLQIFCMSILSLTQRLFLQWREAPEEWRNPRRVAADWSGGAPENVSKQINRIPCGLRRCYMQLNHWERARRAMPWVRCRFIN